MDDICHNILKLLPIKSIYLCSQICKSFSRAFYNELLWKEIYTDRLEKHGLLVDSYRITCKLYYSIIHYRTNKLSHDISSFINKTNIEFYISNFKFIPTEIGLMKNLNKIILSNHIIRVIPTEICTLPFLKFLMLGNNIISNIPPMIDNLTSLTKLDLADNNIEIIPTTIGNLTNLINLDLANNKIKIIPTTIGNSIELTHINFKNNMINTIPTEIMKLSKLLAFELYDNNITDISNIDNDFIKYRIGI